MPEGLNKNEDEPKNLQEALEIIKNLKEELKVYKDKAGIKEDKSNLDISNKKVGEINSFEDMGRVEKRAGFIYVSVNTDKGPVKFQLNSYDPDDSICEVGFNDLNIFNQNWMHYKLTPKDILRALLDHGFTLKKE